MSVVVAGASGFVGSHLVDALLAKGRTVRCGTRSPERAMPRDRTWVHLDVDAPDGIRPALEGADTLVYLVHGLGAAHHDGLLEREEGAARRVLAAAEAAGLRRIVFLGGPRPSGPISEHLEARLRTGEILRSGKTSTIELRASMIIGMGSQSWWICRDLAMRLPVMVLPKWTSSRSQPVAIADVVRALVAAVELDQSDSAVYDLPGPEILSARQILERVARLSGRQHPRMVPVPALTPRLSSWWLRLVTRADYVLARQLVDGLTGDLLADGDRDFWAHLDHGPMSFDDAVRAALDAEGPGRGWGGLLERVVRRVS